MTAEPDIYAKLNTAINFGVPNEDILHDLLAEVKAIEAAGKLAEARVELLFAGVEEVAKRWDHLGVSGQLREILVQARGVRVQP